MADGAARPRALAVRPRRRVAGRVAAARQRGAALQRRADGEGLARRGARAASRRREARPRRRPRRARPSACRSSSMVTRDDGDGRAAVERRRSEAAGTLADARSSRSRSSSRCRRARAAGVNRLFDLGPRGAVARAFQAHHRRLQAHHRRRLPAAHPPRARHPPRFSVPRRRAQDDQHLRGGEALTVENARAKTTLHPRCGTTFLVMVALVSILVFTAVGAALAAHPHRQRAARQRRLLPREAAVPAGHRGGHVRDPARLRALLHDGAAPRAPLAGLPRAEDHDRSSRTTRSSRSRSRACGRRSSGKKQAQSVRRSNDDVAFPSYDALLAARLRAARGRVTRRPG